MNQDLKDNMTAEKFKNPETDMMEVYFFYYNLKKGKSIPFELFRHAFSMWIFNVVGFGMLSRIQYYVIKELNKHFEL